jgi:type IV pilus assembly protein PilW
MKHPHNRLRARESARSQQAGFGLVELLISLVLGLLIVGGVIGIFVSNQQVFRTNENLGRLQENARVSFEVMARELRQAGGNLCGAKVVSNVLLNSTTAWSSNWDAGAIIGFDNTAVTTAVTIGTTPGLRVTGTDAIQILGGALGHSANVAAHDTATATLTLAPAIHGFKKGDIVMVCDSISAAIAQLSDDSGANVLHAKDATAAPGNCAQGLGSPTSCTGTGTLKTVQLGGFVSEFSAGTWYIAHNSRSGKSLFRKGVGAAEEIAEGVVDMQLDYLLRDVATGTPDADWSAASTVADWTSAAAKQVVAVRVKLSLETLGKIGTDQQPIKRDLVYVINLRNRLN